MSDVPACIEWLNRQSAGVTAFATLVIAGATVVYVVTTIGILRASNKMADSSRRLTEAQLEPAVAFQLIPEQLPPKRQRSPTPVGRKKYPRRIQFRMENLSPVNLVVSFEMKCEWREQSFKGPRLSGFYAKEKPWPLQPRHAVHGPRLHIFDDLLGLKEEKACKEIQTPADNIIRLRCTITYYRPDAPDRVTQNVEQVYCYDIGKQMFYLDV